MEILDMPFCCTSAILGSFGEHGEPSVVTVDEIKRLVASKKIPKVDRDTGELVENAKRCVFAISVDRRNINTLKEAGFHVVDIYPGVQGLVHVLTLHV